MSKRFPIKPLQLLGLMIVGLGVIVAAHLIEPQYLSRNAKTFIKTFHAPGFAAVSFLLVGVFRRNGLGMHSYFYASATAFAAGLISEFAQMSGPRHADLNDLLRDFVGICAGLGIAGLFDTPLRKSLSRYRFGVLMIFTGAALFVSLKSSVASASALLARNATLPSLLTFANRWESHLYEEAKRPTTKVIPRPIDWPVQDDDLVLYSEAAGRYKTFIHLQPYPDWRTYDSFSFVAASADEKEHDVIVTIRDIRPDQDSPRNSFHGNIVVTTAAKRYTFTLAEIESVAADRPFDLQHVDIVILSLSGQAFPASLLLDDFRLH